MRNYIGVPESYDSEARGPEKVVSPTVVAGAFGMLTPIQLDDQPSIDRGEVANVESDLMLSPELEISQLSPPEATPQETFDIGLISPESAAVFEHPGTCLEMSA